MCMSLLPFVCETTKNMVEAKNIYITLVTSNHLFLFFIKLHLAWKDAQENHWSSTKTRYCQAITGKNVITFSDLESQLHFQRCASIETRAGTDSIDSK